MCCTRLAEIQDSKNRQKLFATKACIDNMKKLVKQQYLLHMSSQYGELRPTKSQIKLRYLATSFEPASVMEFGFNGWDRLAGFEHPSKFQPVSRLGFVTAPTSLNGGQQNFAPCLAVSWAGTPHIHFRMLLPFNGILPRAKFTLRPSLAFCYIGGVTARHSSSQPNAAFSRGRHLYPAGWPSRWASAHIVSVLALRFQLVFALWKCLMANLFNQCCSMSTNVKAN